MKLKEQYQKTKLKNLCSVILIKLGSFYVTFLEDAIILNYLFNYQVKDNKVGFPINSIDKVLFELREQQLNYIVINETVIRPLGYKEYSSEQYKKILQLAKKYEFEQNSNKILIERIQYLIDVNPNNYNKIKEFIDEL